MIGKRAGATAAIAAPSASSVSTPDLTIGAEATGSYNYSGSFPEAIAPPIVDRILLTGTLEIGETLTATLNGISGDDTVGTCEWRVFRSSDTQQGTETLVETIMNHAGVDITYTIQEADEGKYMRVECDVKGSTGLSGETISSDYSAAVAISIPSFGDVVWQPISNCTVDGSGDPVQSSGGAATAESVQFLAANKSGDYQYDWAANTRQLVITGFVPVGSSPTWPNTALFIYLLSANANIDIYNGQVAPSLGYRATVSNRQSTPAGGSTQSVQYRIRVSRNTGTVAGTDKLFAETRVNNGAGGPYGSWSTHYTLDNVANSALKIGFVGQGANATVLNGIITEYP